MLTRTEIRPDRSSVAVAAVVFGLVLGLGVSGGCGGAAAPETVDRGAARATLTRALDAWKGGETPETLLEASPSLHVADDEWRAGAKLESYEIQGEGEAVGNRWACKATLTLKDKAGKARRQTASYNVSTEPTLSVVRLEE